MNGAAGGTALTLAEAVAAQFADAGGRLPVSPPPADPEPREVGPLLATLIGATADYSHKVGVRRGPWNMAPAADRRAPASPPNAPTAPAPPGPAPTPPDATSGPDPMPAAPADDPRPDGPEADPVSGKTDSPDVTRAPDGDPHRDRATATKANTRATPARTEASRFAWLDRVAALPGEAGDKALLWALAFHADREGQCYPAGETLAVESGHSVSTVRRRLRKMQKRGHVAVDICAVPIRLGDRTYYLNRYRLTLPEATPRAVIAVTDKAHLKHMKTGEAAADTPLLSISLSDRLRAAMPFNVDADTWLAYVRQRNPEAKEAELAAAVDRLAAAKRDNERLRVSADTLAEYTRKIHVGQWRATA